MLVADCPFMSPRAPGGSPPSSIWTPQYINMVYSTTLWKIVKDWELNQEFGLEGLAKTVFLNPQAEKPCLKVRSSKRDGERVSSSQKRPACRLHACVRSAVNYKVGLFVRVPGRILISPR